MEATWTAADGTVYDLTIPYLDSQDDAWTCVGWLAGMGGKLHSVCDLPTPLMHNSSYSFDVAPLTQVIATHGPITPAPHLVTTVTASDAKPFDMEA